MSAGGDQRQANTNQSLYRVTAGKVIAWFTGKTLFSRKKHNEIVACLNPLLNIKIVEAGMSYNVLYSDREVWFVVPRRNKAEGGGTTDPGATVTRFRVKVDYGDYLLCGKVLETGLEEVDQDNHIVPYNVHKPRLLRTTTTSRTLKNGVGPGAFTWVTWSFSYAALDTSYAGGGIFQTKKWVRTATAPNYETETNTIQPEYEQAGLDSDDRPKSGGDEIWAIEKSDETNIDWIDTNFEARKWASVPLVPPP